MSAELCESFKLHPLDSYIVLPKAKIEHFVFIIMYSKSNIQLPMNHVKMYARELNVLISNEHFAITISSSLATVHIMCNCVVTT